MIRKLPLERKNVNAENFKRFSISRAENCFVHFVYFEYKLSRDFKKLFYFVID